jgi:hypothetical protein
MSRSVVQAKDLWDAIETLNVLRVVDILKENKGLLFETKDVRFRRTGHGRARVLSVVVLTRRV